MTSFAFLLIGMLLTLSLLALSKRFIGFRAQRPADLASRGPRFDPRQHLNGPILCEGVIYGPTGRVTSRFVADMTGSWDGNTGTLSERFRYDSGAVQDRCWTLRLGNDGSIRAEAADVVGAGHGQAEGPAVQMRYRIKLDADAGGHELDVTDWMYLMENGTILNRSQFTKFGVTVAELVATMRKVPG
ncbi:DUF3833 domain-containing protein [Pseudorhodobacter sp. MZDSW-24AT]|uniref:DUF3833 domain-containing protein n=1 Tax=Pseudorhodobacter sp. MZDSW-24AT TaxID=2052957 RepID=UPI000C1E4552|nr:DUF3833 domain-containing protein [Pseudorhodobacter sp. MZDSW-24AT]PJF08629.1 DUF3833 domain-containing protein [Pseudorhodobacter sp. MZDSW-24AT]